MKIANPRTLTELDELQDCEMVFYSTKTCWWTTKPEDLCCPHGNPMSTCPDAYGGIPLDPAGAPLFQTDKVRDFLAQAAKDAESGHYGPHGVEAFVLAYHGNVLSDDGLPRCSTEWEQYNNLLDEEPSHEA